MKNCEFFTDCHISFCPPNLIGISRCCQSVANPVIKMTVKDWEKIPNKVEFLEKYFLNTWLSPPMDKLMAEWCRKGIDKCRSTQRIQQIKNFQISISPICNAVCDFCVSTDKRKFISSTSFQEEILKSYYDTLDNITLNLKRPTIVRLTDQGEPLIPYSRLFDWWEKAESNTSVSQIWVTTNGHTLGTNEEIFNMIDNSKKAYIHVSLNGLTSEYRKIRMGLNDFDEVCKAIKFLYDSEKLSRVSYVISSEDDIKDISENVKWFYENIAPTQITLWANCFTYNENIVKVQSLLKEFPQYLKVER